jgi:hypothetical protein
LRRSFAGVDLYIQSSVVLWPAKPGDCGTLSESSPQSRLSKTTSVELRLALHVFVVVTGEIGTRRPR